MQVEMFYLLKVIEFLEREYMNSLVFLIYLLFLNDHEYLYEFQFNLSSLEVGAIFSVSTAIYTVCSPLWGQLSDRFGLNKTVIVASGSVLVAAGFVMLGPLDFISKERYKETRI